MRKTVRIGVIGCGGVTAYRHFPALSRVPNAEVVALADCNPTLLKSVADNFRVPHRYPDVRTLLDKTSVDVIAVCVPVEFHAEVALAALDAQKHVFIEKPLAVDLEEADRIRERAVQVSCKVQVGFNFRWHRLIRQAQELMQQGAVGQVEMIRTVFASAHEISEWRMRRCSGGGALFDQAIHLFDLWRFLLKTEVAEVFATTRSGPWEDETAMVTARLTNGVLATAACSERTGENNEVEIYGRKGRLHVSFYRFDGLSYLPQGSIPGNGRSRLEALARTLKTLPGSLAQLRHGGDVLASYREQWLHFLNAICEGENPDCTVDDGRRAMEIVFAAMASASTGQAVRLDQAPRQVTPLHDVQYRVKVSGADMSQNTASSSNAGPALSIIIVTDRYETIRQTVRHLKAQTRHEQFELLIVTQSAKSLGLDSAETAGFCRVEVVEVPAIFPLSPATSAGIRRATAPLVVFAESHAFPGPGWANALIEAHREPWAAVGAVIGNANPGIISWANLFVDYGGCVETNSAESGTYLPGHHTAYKRDILLQYDSQLEAVMESEILLHWDIQTKGYQLRLEPAARIYHVNVSSLAAWLPERFYGGRRFAASRCREWSVVKRLIYSAGSLLIPLVRFPRVCSDLRRSTCPRMQWPLILPPLFLGLVASAVGEMAGYAFGAGNAMLQAAKMELFKFQFLTKRDRRKLEAWSLQVARQVAP
jgi:myo-inositol 2-dehydrogenase/D-chiro-inositol 1-dehydrogenase